jgi:hypothetical protein
MEKQQKTHPKKQTKTKNKQKQQQKTTQIPQCQSSSENLIKKS